ncbi:hypothetical protein [Magnetospira sp. QH-2]|uniref:hypothetical protein n=1 Tax=Magnetospira sp. (strain QH-2) TaxID=1288970 RepID=UPI0003E80B3C|nr:hypothetical protein [Magnetospira sp. QH-2]CCQ72397.1 protein of unknown function [Magnetospira sp. QH-2]
MSLRPIRFAILILALSISACASAPDLSPPTPVTPVGGSLPILGPSLMFDPIGPPTGWLLLGDRDAARVGLSVTRRNGVPALRVSAAPSDGFALLRPVDASPLAVPFLDWFRFHTSEVTGPPGARLLVGFTGSATNREAPPPFEGLPKGLRWLTVPWPSTARPIAQGRWIRESADLSVLHRRAWPAADPTRTRIRFLGLTLDPNAAGSPDLLLSGLTLTR